MNGMRISITGVGFGWFRDIVDSEEMERALKLPNSGRKRTEWLDNYDRLTVVLK